MAGTDSPTPENKVAQTLIGDNTANTPAQPDHQPDFANYIYNAPNADKPGAKPAATDKQAGGPQDPGADASAKTTTTVADNTPAAKPADNPAAATKPADNPTAAAKPADNPTAAAKPADNTAAAGSDANRTPDVLAANKHALDVMKQVNAILDNDVPKFNKAHDLDDAKKAYDQAIALAKTLTPQEIAEAQKDLAQVRADKKAATDPDAKRDLADKEVALYTVTRLQDAALGNMALWYYRQGKTEDGNAKLLEASGVDPDTAQQLKKMGDNEIKAYGAILNKGDSISPILGDANFFRQINKIKAAGVDVPPIFGQINQAVIAHNAEVAKAGGNAPGSNPSDKAPTGSDKGQPGADATAPYDADKNNADMQAFIDLNNKLKDHPGPITADQKAVLEAGIKAYDAQNTYVGNAMDASQKALDAVMPDHAKQDAYGKALDTVNTELTKLAVDTPITDDKGNKTTVKALPPDLQTKVTAIVSAKTPADFQAAAADLAKTQPTLAKAFTDGAALLPSGADGLAVMKAYKDNSALQDAFVKSSMQQVLAHYSYAKILSQDGNDADKAHAKDVFTSGFQNVPKVVAQNVLNSQEAQTLGKTLGLADKAPAGADNGAGATGATPGADQGTGLAGLSVQDLQTKLDAAKKLGPAGMNDAKALYEEEIRRAEDPDRKKAFNDQLTANVTALESGKDANGQAIDAAGRMKLHEQNIQLISALSTAAQLHSEYALYLGDGRLALDDDSKNVAKLQGGLNQLKSMDAQQKLAIAAADSVDIGLLKRADAQIVADKKAGIGDPKELADFRVAMEGGKDGQGNEQLGMMSMRVTLRDQLAALYLMQGKQFNADGSVAAQLGGSTHHTDELFKPQDALALLKQAQTANEQVNGKGAHDTTTDQLLAMGTSLQPDVFKDNASDLKAAGANGLSDLAAMGGSVVGSTVVKFAAVALAETLTEGKLNPALLNTIGTASAIGSGILTRHVAHQLITGQSESWADSALHGTAAALVPIGFKYTSELLSSNKLASTVLNYRSSAITGEAIVQRAAGAIGPDATFAQVADQFNASGLTKEAGALRALGGKAVSSASAEELASLNQALNLDGARGREAMVKLFPTMDRAATDAKIVNALGNRDINKITTVGELQGALDGSAQRVTGLAARFDNTVSDSTPIKTALKGLKSGTGADAKAVYATQEAVDNDAKFLADNNVKTVGQLRSLAAKSSEYFNVGKMFPEMAGADAATSLKDIGLRGGFTSATAEGRVQLKNILPESHLGPPVKAPGWFAKAGGAIDGLPRKAYDAAWSDRMWNVSMDRPVVSFPNIGKGAANAVVDGAAADGSLSGRLGRIGDQVKAIPGQIRQLPTTLKPEFGTPSMPNLQKIDPLFASAKQVGISDAQTKFWTAAAATGVSMGGYNAATGLYDNWYKGKQYKGADGEWHKYTILGTLGSAAETTVGEALMGGFILKGAVPAALEAAPATAQAPGWLASKIPILGNQAAREAVAGSGAQLKNFLKFGVLGTPMGVNGYLDLRNASDKQSTYDSTQVPLHDYAPDDVGTQADQVQGQGGQTPADNTPVQPADNTPAKTTDNPANPAPTKDTTVVDPNADTTSNQAANPAANPAANATAQQNPPAANNSNTVGGGIQAPGD
jgi:hypothetical protein